MNYAFEKLGASRVISLIHLDNAASRQVAQKLGEKPEGKIELFGSEALVYAISREDWQSMP